MSYPKEYSDNLILPSKRWQSLHRRLVVLLGGVLPVTILIIVFTVSLFLPPLKWEIWLLFGGGIFLLGLVGVRLTNRILRQYTIQSLEEFQTELEEVSEDKVSPAVAVVGERINDLSNNKIQVGLRKAEREPAEVMRTLQEAKKELEAKVKRSTTELRYANERLQLELKGRQQAEDALQESEERYRQLVEFSPDGIIIHTEDKIAFINAAGAKILGATEPEQLIGKRMIDFVYPDDQQVMEERLRQVNEEKQRMSPIQQKFIRLDGTTAEVEVIDIPFADKNRPAVQLVVRDITERKKAEVEIAQRNRELTILQAAGVAITSRLDLRYVLDTVAQEMAQLLEVECCTIFEWDQTENTTTQIARYGSKGWWDPNSKAEVYNLAEYPLTKSILEEQIPEQMTISRHNIDPSELDYMKRTNLKTLLMLPMIFQRRVLGLVKLEDSRIERTFTHQEISLAKLLASQAASAIENARLFDELRQRVTELMTLNEISQAITSTLDLQEMLTIINKHIIQLLNVATSSVVLYDEVERSLWVAAVSGEGSNLGRGKRLPLGEGVVGWVIESSKAVLVPDISKDARFDSIFKQEHSFVIRSILCVPLQAKGKTIGAVEAINKADELFDQADLRLLQSVAAPAATAIDNARLFEQAQDEIGERLHAEAALKEERALLAQRVKERTAELSKANAELARASRLKDEFLAGMSHELRTPLNSILGFSEILQIGAFGELNERQLKYTSNIEESGRHLLLLINDILDISKVEAGKLELEIGPVSVESVCQASLRLVKELAHQKQLKVSTTFNNNIITILHADERRLKQILVNLLSNAIKFTPEKGEIGLEVGEDTEKQVIHFTVWDTGIGISREDMRQLFQPFVQLDSSLARQYAGTGLGLSLVLRLVELHGGGISMESEVGQGSRFTISLPRSGRAILANPISGVQPAGVDKPALTIDQKLKAAEHPLILLTDDNEDHLNMILEFLQVHGYQTITARNGSEAIAQAKEEKPDVILMDIQMPGMDGLEATRRLRADADLVNIPIIALTALAMPGDRERCLQAGANEYLSKPLSPSELVKKIETFLK